MQTHTIIHACKLYTVTLPLQAFMVMVWNFQLYMLPLTLIVIFMWCLIVIEIKGGATQKPEIYKLLISLTTNVDCIVVTL